MTVNVFSVPVFFVVFRESLETVVVCSVLLAFLKQSLDGPGRDVAVYKKLVRQVWLGAGLGFLICLIIGAGVIAAFYKSGADAWSGTEDYWEGAFAIFASVIITIVGAGMLRLSKMQDKWRIKISKAMEEPILGRIRAPGGFKRFCEKYAMFMLPFITVLREGLEAVVFVAGVSFSTPASSVPLPVFVGLAAGLTVGYLIYKGGASSKIQYFLVISTCFLYLVAAGLFSRAVWYLEAAKWNTIVGSDADEVGSGPGSYDISKSVWHINFGNPEINGGSGWGIFNAILGWQNSATYGSVISYNVYWIVVILGFFAMRFHETKGHWPLLKSKATKTRVARAGSVSDGSSGVEHDNALFQSKAVEEKVAPTQTA